MKNILNLIFKVLIATYFISYGCNLQLEGEQSSVVRENILMTGYEISSFGIQILCHIQIAAGLAFLFQLNIASYIGIVVFLLNSLISFNCRELPYFGIKIVIIAILLSSKRKNKDSK